MTTAPTCTYCLAPLELGDTNYTCQRCYRWRRRCSKSSAALTEDQLHELEGYSRQIRTRPLTPQERELEEIAAIVQSTRRHA